LPRCCLTYKLLIISTTCLLYYFLWMCLLENKRVQVESYQANIVQFLTSHNEFRYLILMSRFNRKRTCWWQKRTMQFWMSTGRQNCYCHSFYFRNRTWDCQRSGQKGRKGFHGRQKFRKTEAGNKIITEESGSDNVAAIKLDLCVLKSVVEFVKSKGGRLDILVNNAGVYYQPRVITKDGRLIRDISY